MKNELHIQTISKKFNPNILIFILNQVGIFYDIGMYRKLAKLVACTQGGRINVENTNTIQVMEQTRGSDSENIL